MTIMVDELQVWPVARGIFTAGSCHLTTDGELDDLHAFAARIGMRRAWFQSGRIPHYDLTEGRRQRALAAGAVFVPAKEQARRRIAKRAEGRAAAEEQELAGMDIEAERARWAP